MSQGPHYREIHTLSDYEYLVATEQLVVILFMVEMSPACHATLHSLKELLGRYNNDFVLGVVNKDVNHALTRAFEVYTVPTVFFIENQAVVEIMQGLVPLKQVESLIQAHLK